QISNPFMSGKNTSSKMSSGLCSRTQERAGFPSGSQVGSNPQRLKCSLSNNPVSRSSSTTRATRVMAHPLSPEWKGTSSPRIVPGVWCRVKHPSIVFCSACGSTKFVLRRREGSFAHFLAVGFHGLHDVEPQVGILFDEAWAKIVKQAKHIV